MESLPMLDSNEMQETEFFKDFTAEEFFSLYMRILITLCNASSDKKHFRRTIKKIISFQTETTKINLMEFYGKRAERQVVTCLTESVELYRFKK